MSTFGQDFGSSIHSATPIGVGHILVDLDKITIEPPTRELFRSKRGAYFSEVEQALLESTALLRLDDVYQMSLRFSVRGQNMDHTRLEHSIDVMDTAGLVALQLGLSREEIQLVRVAALLHDLAHPPFAHAGERVMQTFNKNFDHDVWIRDAIFSPEIRGILEKFNISPKAVADILDESGDSHSKNILSFVVKEVADRMCYLRMDSSFTAFSPEVKDAYEHLTRRFERSLFVERSRIGTNDPQAAERVLWLRYMLYQEYSASPTAMLVNEVLIDGVRKLAKAGKLDQAEFPKMTDGAVLELLEKYEPRVHRWLTEGVERHFTPIFMCRETDLNEKGLRLLTTSKFRKDARTILDPDIFVGWTEDYSKSLNMLQYTEESPIKSYFEEFSREIKVDPSMKFLFVCVPTDKGADGILKAEAWINRYLSPLLINGGKTSNLRNEMFGHINHDLYQS